MNKQRLLYTFIESNFQVLKILVDFRAFNFGYSGPSERAAIEGDFKWESNK